MQPDCRPLWSMDWRYGIGYDKEQRNGIIASDEPEQTLVMVRECSRPENIAESISGDAPTCSRHMRGHATRHTIHVFRHHDFTREGLSGLAILNSTGHPANHNQCLAVHSSTDPGLRRIVRRTRCGVVSPVGTVRVVDENIELIQASYHFGIGVVGDGREYTDGDLSSG